MMEQYEEDHCTDPVNHPPHYKSHPSGIECIEVTEHMGFNLGNAVKYIWRCDEKKDAIEDLKKAAWYIQREIEKRLKEKPNGLKTPNQNGLPRGNITSPGSPIRASEVAEHAYAGSGLYRQFDQGSQQPPRST